MIYQLLCLVFINDSNFLNIIQRLQLQNKEILNLNNSGLKLFNPLSAFNPITSIAMQTQVSVHPFYSTQTNSSSMKVKIKYPQSISNLAYNFQLRLTIFIQSLLPRITYNQVHEQVMLLPKTQIIVNQLQPGKMYKVTVQWTKKGHTPQQTLKDSKNIFVCSQKIPQNQQHNSQQFSEVPNQEYSGFVKDNIQSYFNQYHNNNHRAQSSNGNRSKPKQNSSFKSSQQSISYRTSSQHKKANPKQQLCSSQSILRAIGESDSFINKKNLEKYILQGRSSSSIKDYLTTKDFQCFNSCNKLYKNENQRRKHVEKTLLVAKAMNMFGEIYAFDQEHGIISSTTGSSFRKTNENKGKQFFKNDWFMGPFYSYDANQKQMKRKDTQNIE